MEPADAPAAFEEAIRHQRQDILRELITTLGTQDLDAFQNLMSDVRSYDASLPQMTMLHFATALNQPDAVRTLLSAGANPSLKDENGQSAYVLAVSEPLKAAFVTSFLQHIAMSDLPKVEAMVLAGLPLDASDGGRQRNLPLHWASSFGQVNIVKYLCAKGADCNAINADGATALHDAAARGDISIVQTLLDAGADPTVVGTAGKVNGKRPYDIISEKDSAKCAQIQALLLKATLHETTLPVLEQNSLQCKGVSSTEVTAGSINPVKGSTEPLLDAAGPAVDTTEPVPVANIRKNIQSLKVLAPEYVEIDHKLKMLWPAPKHLVQLKGSRFILPDKINVVVTGAVTAVVRSIAYTRLCDQLCELGVQCSRLADFNGTQAHMILSTNPTVIARPEEYRLVTTHNSITITAGEDAGLLHGISTTIQAIRLFEAHPRKGEITSACTRGIPPLRIRDFPDLKDRGLMLDVSRNKVPTLKSLKKLVVLIASLKYNQLQLNFGHAFLYVNHRKVSEGTNPYTGPEILELADFCSVHGIALIPHQNALTHFGKWLVHEDYAGLAECPNGVDFEPRPDGSAMTASWSLCPADPRSLMLIDDLYQELFPHFPHSSLAHVGMDMPVDLGTGRSATECADDSGGRVYLDHLHAVRDIVKRHGRTPLVWADVLQGLPESTLNSLPVDVVLCEWGFEESHPFDARCGRLAASAIPFIVCPGTSSWCSLTGRTANCIENIKAAARGGVTHGALGLLLVDRGDVGHTQPLCLSYPGILAAGGYAWNSEPAGMDKSGGGLGWEGYWGQSDLAKLLDFHVFGTNQLGLGEVVCELGNAYLHAGGGAIVNQDGTALFRLLLFPELTTPVLPAGLSFAGLRACAKHLKRQITAIDDIATVESNSLTTILDELRLAGEMALLACQIGQALLRHECCIQDLPITQRTDLANRLLPIIDSLKATWLAENRRGGLHETVTILGRTVQILLAE